MANRVGLIEKKRQGQGKLCRETGYKKRIYSNGFTISTGNRL